MLKSISGGEVAWVVHGDTLSTLLGTLFALRMRGRLIHVEAGLRSNKVLHPFPEELVRRAVARFSAVNFAPSIDAVANLRRSPGKTILTRGNTAIDAMDLVQDSKNIFYEQPYCLVLLHRTEFVRNSAVMVETLGELVKISKELTVVMVQDFASETLIRKYSSEIGSLVVIEKQSYVAFQNLLNGASFVITDSGGLQEECAILGKPCLVHRKATERIDGLGENAVLSLWKKGAVSDFSSKFKNYERDSRDSYISPTSIIIDELQSLNYL
jgi:UDP-N-acetylglucosamine 2-epimerase (non-hydrolysing)